MKFDYTSQYTDFGIARMPLVFVEFSNPADSLKRREVFSLVDSGAAATLINAQYAQELGIDLQSGKRIPFQGIKGTPAIGYEHLIKIRLTHDSREVTVPCYFMPDLQISALLGQAGFFENYKVLFEHYKKRFELTPR